MPKRPRAGYTGPVYHVVNRATKGQTLFDDFGEYLSFLRILAWALRRTPVGLFAYCAMPNHWHFLLQVVDERELSRFIYDLTKTHAQALRHWRGNKGAGAVYKGRYRPSLVQTESYFYRAVRYVERNPVRAGLAERADAWMWSSASRIGSIQGITLAKWPVPRPEDWAEFVNELEPPADLEFIRKCVRRGASIEDATVTIEKIAIRRTRTVAVPAKR